MTRKPESQASRLKRNIKNNARYAIRPRDKKKLIFTLIGGKCADCNVSDLPLCCYDFHHIREKSFSLNSREMWIRHIQEILTEALKCVPLCANCHRKRHLALDYIACNIA